MRWIRKYYSWVRCRIKIILQILSCSWNTRWRRIYNNKWCVYSIFPIASRVNHPALHLHTDTLISRRGSVAIGTPKHWPLWAVELDRFPLAAGGGERNAPNMLELLLFRFLLGLHRGGGKYCVSWRGSETAPNITGHYVSQQCQNALVCLENRSPNINKKIVNESKNEFGKSSWRQFSVECSFTTFIWNNRLQLFQYVFVL
jgi:hypothetical protein